MHIPQALVKMVRNGGTRSPARLRKQLSYLSQGGAVKIERSERYGSEPIEPKDFRATADEWALHTGVYQPGQRPATSSRDMTTHIVLSFPSGTDADRVYGTCRDWAARMFGNAHHGTFDYVTAFHTDRPHPHFHVVVNRRSFEGEWLKISKRDTHFSYENMRRVLLEAAIDHGIEMEATSRQERGVDERPLSDVQYRHRSAAALIEDDLFIRIEDEDGELGRDRPADAQNGDGGGDPDTIDLRRGCTPPLDWDEAAQSLDVAMAQPMEDAPAFDDESDRSGHLLLGEPRGAGGSQDGGDSDAGEGIGSDEQFRSLRSGAVSPEEDLDVPVSDDELESQPGGTSSSASDAEADIDQTPRKRRQQAAESGPDRKRTRHGPPQPDVEAAWEQQEEPATPGRDNVPDDEPENPPGGGGPASDAEADIDQTPRKRRQQAAESGPDRKRTRHGPPQPDVEAAWARQEEPATPGRDNVPDDEPENPPGGSASAGDAEANIDQGPRKRRQQEAEGGPDRKRARHGPPNVTTRSQRQAEQALAEANQKLVRLTQEVAGLRAPRLGPAGATRKMAEVERNLAEATERCRYLERAVRDAATRWERKSGENNGTNDVPNRNRTRHEPAGVEHTRQAQDQVRERAVAIRDRRDERDSSRGRSGRSLDEEQRER